MRIRRDMMVIRARVVPAKARFRVRARRAAVLAAVPRRSRHRAAALRVAALASRDLHHAASSRLVPAGMCTTHANVTSAVIQAFSRAGAAQVGKIYRGRYKAVLFRRGAFGLHGAFGPCGGAERRSARTGHRLHVESDRMHGARRRGRNGRRGRGAVAGSRLLFAPRRRSREMRDPGQRAGSVRRANAGSRGTDGRRGLLQPPRCRSAQVRDPGRCDRAAARGPLFVHRLVGERAESAGVTRFPVATDRRGHAGARDFFVRRIRRHAFRADAAARKYDAAGHGARSAVVDYDAASREVLVRRLRRDALRTGAAVQRDHAAGIRARPAHFDYDAPPRDVLVRTVGGYAFRAGPAIGPDDATGIRARSTHIDYDAPPRDILVRRLGRYAGRVCPTPRHHAVAVLVFRFLASHRAGTAALLGLALRRDPFISGRYVSTGGMPVVLFQVLISATLCTMRSSTPSTDSRVSGSSG
jgi:hypothetical protein